MPAFAQARYRRLIEGRVRGVPAAYLLGRREFWSLDLEVTPAVLVPRPETERLIELALRLVPASCALQLADLGTGSGAIALALARERPECRVIATDVSAAALALAASNATRLGLRNVEFRRGHWCAPLGRDRPALIVANPPYVASRDPHLQGDGVRFEPRGALVGARTVSMPSGKSRPALPDTCRLRAACCSNTEPDRVKRCVACSQRTAFATWCSTEIMHSGSE